METDYTSTDAQRLLAIGISDDQACGYCQGDCQTCLQEASELIAKVRSEALREAAEATRNEAPGETNAGSTFNAHANWLEARADRIEETDG